MAANHPESSQAFIRALKGSLDPPQPGGASKIELATKTWHTDSLYLPNKDEVLVDWILMTFLKEKANAQDSNSICNLSYWSLLADILTASRSPTQRKTTFARPTQIWLIPLLNRIPVAPIVSSFFSLFASTGTKPKDDLAQFFSRCVLILWPMAVQRTNVDALMSCYGSMLAFTSANLSSDNDNGLTEVSLMITSSYRSALSTTTNRKKFLSTFLQSHLKQWIICISCHTSSTLATEDDKHAKQSLISAIYLSGADVLFTFEALKSASQDVFSSLSSLLNDRLSHANRSSLYILPSLFQSYEHAVRKHRLALFGSGANLSQDHAVQDKVKEAGIKGFVSCYTILRDAGDGEEVWEITTSLLGILDKANLVASGVPEHLNTLRDIGKWSIDALADSSNETRLQRTISAIEVLSALTRIDFDIVAPLIPPALRNLLMAHPSANSASETLLRLLLEHYVKTRTVNAYIELIVDCLFLDASITQQSDQGLHSVYHSSASSAILSIGSLNELTKSVKGFITPGQVHGTVQFVVDALRSTLKLYEGAGSKCTIPVNAEASEKLEKGKKKRRKAVSDPAFSNQVNVTASTAAISFSHLARVATAVLPSLPFSTMPQSALNVVKSTVSDCWDEYLLPAIQNGLRSYSEMLPSDYWPAQVVLAAILRLHHAVTPNAPSPSLCFFTTVEFGADLDAQLINKVKDSDTLPELVVESMRYLMAPGTIFDVNQSHASAVVDTLLEYLCAHLEEKADISWSGISCDLNPFKGGGTVRCALALWHLSLDSWLPILDEIASTEHMNRLAELCVRFMSSSLLMSNHEITANWVMRRAASSALFWESPNLRDALLNIVTQKVAFLDAYEMHTMLESIQQKKSKPPKLNESVPLTAEQVSAVTAAYEALLLSPVVYVPRSSRSDFFKRALIADVAICMSLDQIEEYRPTGHEPRTILRSWLKRMTEAFGFVEILADSSDLVGYLTRPDCCPDQESPEFISATTELVSATYRHIVRSAVQSDPKKVVDVLGFLMKSYESTFNDSSLSSEGVCRRSILCFINALISECPSISGLPTIALESVAHFSTRIGSLLSAQLSSFTSDEADCGTLMCQGHIIKAWRSYHALLRWLGKNDIVARDFGSILLTRLTANEPQGSGSIEMAARETFYGEVIALLLEELSSKTGAPRQSHLEIIAAAYVFFQGRLVSDGSTACDSHLARACKSLTNEDLSHLFGVITEALETTTLSRGDLRVVVHFSKVLVREAPDGVSGLTQDFIGRCLQIFMNNTVFRQESAPLSLDVLHLIENQCSDRPASVRLLDVGLVWSLLAMFQSGTRRHDQHTCSAIFHAIINITSALIRLRRDLVLSTLPLLSAVLRQLLMVMRTIRPQLGAKQSQIVADTMPWWVSPSEPLGASEAKALGRLLTALQTKTIARRYVSSTAEKQKAESLARPFSKHAPYVMAAYIDAMNDPLCTLPSLVRKELEPGLFSLCGMMTEHGRDAVMVSNLDAGGKVTLKMLWKEYEKQRYIGNG